MAATERGKAEHGTAKRAAADIAGARKAGSAEMRRLLGASAG